MKKEKRLLTISLILIWIFLGIYLFSVFACKYVQPDIRLKGAVFGGIRFDGTTFIRLYAINLGGKTGHKIVATIKIVDNKDGNLVGFYDSYLGEMIPFEEKEFEIDLPGIEWGKDLEVSGTFK